MQALTLPETEAPLRDPFSYDIQMPLLIIGISYHRLGPTTCIPAFTVDDRPFKRTRFAEGYFYMRYIINTMEASFEIGLKKICQTFIYSYESISTRHKIFSELIQNFCTNVRWYNSGSYRKVLIGIMDLLLTFYHPDQSTCHKGMGVHTADSVSRRKKMIKNKQMLAIQA
ncbi:MAG: hypothetical protein IPP49_09480 [Saprospiraceae bacterium]|nr:hypothetical protein [Saprospiraceae bacterium]